MTDLNLAVANLDEFRDVDCVMAEKIKEYALAHKQVSVYFAINENVAATTYKALKEAGIEIDIDENAESFEGNALIVHSRR